MNAAAALLIWAAMSAGPQAPAAPATPPSRFGIEDNSFLVEEALNQERGIFQNIFVATRSRDGGWTGSFTQEWPLGGQRHQFSYTVPFSRAGGAGDIGDVFVNYRVQVWDGGDARPAFSPRLSWSRSAWQINLPFSKEVDRFYFHANAGNTWADDRSTPFVAGSAIFAARPMLNLMLEIYNEWRPHPSGHRRATTVSPGLRGGWNIGDAQFILGVAAPITRGAIRDHGVLGYLSYELPFSKNR
ncbi:MAG: hypothetical protein EPO35_01655 [Acidobacteria bacterium]|nr:MAG: hypothetical protein EPO35_01655 [Acidobacteriota bacterium]